MVVNKRLNCNHITIYIICKLTCSFILIKVLKVDQWTNFYLWLILNIKANKRVDKCCLTMFIQIRCTKIMTHKCLKQSSVSHWSSLLKYRNISRVYPFVKCTVRKQVVKFLIIIHRENKSHVQWLLNPSRKQGCLNKINMMTIFVCHMTCLGCPVA